MTAGRWLNYFGNPLRPPRHGQLSTCLFGCRSHIYHNYNCFLSRFFETRRDHCRI